MSKETTLFVIGDSRTDKGNPITMKFGSFFVALEVDPDTEEILAFNCAHTIELTEDFLRRIFVGRRIVQDKALIENEIDTRYLGASRKAIIVSYRDALKRYKLATISQQSDDKTADKE